MPDYNERSVAEYLRSRLPKLFFCIVLLFMSLFPLVGIATEETSEAEFKLSMGLEEYALTYQSADGMEMTYQAFFEAGKSGAAAGYRAEMVADEQRAVFILMSLEESAESEAMEQLAVESGDDMPPLDLPDLTGQVNSYADFGGRPLLINFFFAKCPPCIEEIPELNKFALENNDIAVLAVTFDSANEALAFSTSRGLKWPVVPDAQDFIDLVGVKVYPTLVMVSAEGKMLANRIGEFESNAEAGNGLQKWVDELMLVELNRQ